MTSPPALMDHKTRSERDSEVVRTPLDLAIIGVRPAIRWGFAFGLLITLLAFAAPLYMLNLYERVLSSRNETTLIMLTGVVIFALLVQSYLEAIRADLLKRASVKFDQAIAGPSFDAIHQAISRTPLSRSVPSLQDVEALRSFISSQAVTSVMDAVWFPIFLIVCFIFHPLIAGLVLATGVIVALITLATSRATKEPESEGLKAQAIATRRATVSFQNYEAVQGLGMRPAMRDHWRRMHEAALGWSIASDDRSVNLRTLGSFVRQLSQTAALALAAYLVLHNQMSAGAIFAVAIIAGKATSPLLSLVANWRSFSAARSARDRLQHLFREVAAPGQKMSLPRPSGDLAVSGLVVTPPGKGVESIILRGINFEVPAASILAVVGPSGCGKSSLLRVLLNVWTPLSGEVRLDGTEIAHWDDQELGRHLGYLPQDVVLFPGTIEQNIARFQNASHEAVLDAAMRAGVHDLVQQLPDGYNTVIGDYANNLSGGQRQKIGLARAFYGNPAVIILDEPSSSLDTTGEEGLVIAMKGLKSRGTTVIFVTHKANLLSHADYVLVLGNGTMKEFGQRANVMQKITQPRVIQARGSVN